MLLRRLLIVSLLCLAPVAQAFQGTGAQQPTVYKRAPQVASVPVPDFKGKTLQQVRDLAVVPGTKTALFATIVPEGAQDGVVATQTPAAHTPVYPGQSRLLITLEARKPSALETFLQGIINAQAEQAKPAQVPDVSGRNADTARRLIEAAGLRARVTGDSGGVAAQQSPAAGRTARAGSTVTVTLALPPTVAPSLYGLHLAQATAALDKSYLRVGDVLGEDGDRATVRSQTVPAGTEVPRGSSIGVALYTPPQEKPPQQQPPPVQQPTGTPPLPEQPPAQQLPAPPQQPPQVFIPSLLKLNRAQAIDVLTSLKLQPGTITGPATGIVNGQSPEAGNLVDPGTTVGFSLAMPPVIVPSVLQEIQTGAEARLKIFSLVPNTSRAADWKAAASHVVVEQSPQAGTTVDAGSTVSIVIGNLVQPPPPSWWSRLPVWTWPAAAVVLALLGLAAWKIPRHPSSGQPLPRLTHEPAAPAVATCTLTPRPAEAEIRTGDSDGPALRFKLKLHDREAAGQTVTHNEPAITRKG
jgi:beta-lactam-binding protein with PASTA domain